MASRDRTTIERAAVGAGPSVLLALVLETLLDVREELLRVGGHAPAREGEGWVHDGVGGMGKTHDGTAPACSCGIPGCPPGAHRKQPTPRKSGVAKKGKATS